MVASRTSVPGPISTMWAPTLAIIPSVAHSRYSPGRARTPYGSSLRRPTSSRQVNLIAHADDAARADDPAPRETGAQQRHRRVARVLGRERGSRLGSTAGA